MSVLCFSAELERASLEEEERQEDERKMLQEMDESARIDYLQWKAQEEEQRKKKEEDDRRAEEEASSLAAEEASLQAELLARYSSSRLVPLDPRKHKMVIHDSRQWRDDGWVAFWLHLSACLIVLVADKRSF